MKLRKCQYCGENFENHLGGQRYCNAQCSDAHMESRIAERREKDEQEVIEKRRLYASTLQRALRDE